MGKIKSKKRLTPKQKKILFDFKFRLVMREFKYGRLYSSNGKKVRSRKQAIAIAFSEARRYIKSN